MIKAEQLTESAPHNSSLSRNHNIVLAPENVCITHPLSPPPHIFCNTGDTGDIVTAWAGHPAHGHGKHRWLGVLFSGLPTTERRLGRDVIRQLGGKLLMATREQRMKPMFVLSRPGQGRHIVTWDESMVFVRFWPKCPFIYFNVWPIIMLGGYQALDMIINFKQEFASWIMFTYQGGLL